MALSFMLITLVFCAAIAIICLICTYSNTRDVENINPPPSPPKLPIIGNLHQIGKQLHRKLHSLSAKYGPLMILNLGSTPFLVISSSEIVDEIIKQQDVLISNRPTKKDVEMFFPNSNGLAFSQHGDYWRFLKKIFITQLLSSRKVEAFQSVREEETKKMMDKIKLASIKNTTSAVNLSELYVDINSSIFSRSAFGRVLNKDYESAGKLVKKAIQQDVLMGNTSRVNNIVNELQTFLDRVIEDHEYLNPYNEQSDVEKDFVDVLLNALKDQNA
ncbi:cytochrome P450 71A19-like [Rutidosis leptorrhynchoides]|uniref:cytochrome P450 71A19-like n=1 Tax=Rutidosis leptorrhynchoides TaxID=125765 RepID=UPI003A996F97